MSFVAPTALWWALLAIPIIALYILRVRLRRKRVSTTMFWDRVFEEKRTTSWWRRLRHLVSLLMQLAFLALLVLALSDPVLSWLARQRQHTVLVIDNSASMNAGEDGTTRLDAAKNRAGDLIRGLRMGDEMAVLSAGTTAKVELGLTGHAPSLGRAVEAIAPTDGPTCVEDAVEAARRLVAGRENGRVVVLSDAAFPDAKELAAAEDVDVIAVGESLDNVAVTRFQARRSLIDPVGYELFAEVANYGKEPVSTRLTITLDDAPVDAVPLEIPPGESKRWIAQQSTAQGGILKAEIDHADALACDNAAVAVLAERPPAKVYLVSADSYFLRRVFLSLPNVQVEFAENVDALPNPLPDGAVLVLHRSVPKELPPGRVFVVQPTSECQFWEIGDELPDPIITGRSEGSPLVAHVRLENVLAPGARAVRLSDTAKPLSSTLLEFLGKQPLYFQLEDESRRVLVLNADVEKGDLALRTAFPILTANAMSVLCEGRGELDESRKTGKTVDVAFEEDESFILTDPSGTERPAVFADGRAVFGPLDQCGVWTLAPKEETSKADGTRFACNLSDPLESDLRASGGISDETEQAVLWAGMTRPIWFYLAILAVLLSTCEWFLYQRRWIT